MTSKHFLFLGSLLLIGGYGVWGIRWGLPSTARTQLFMTPALRNPEFFSKIEKARDDMYSAMGGNHVAYYGRLEKSGQTNTLPTMLNTYSSFLLKTHATDEAATLVMISHLNPLKNRWYPYSFAYGGGYLFPLAVYLAAAHVVHAVRLVSSASFYYMNPEQMARIYLVVRLWSVCGFLVACGAVFSIGKRLFGGSAAVWAMLFFGLTPTCLAYIKYAKPHSWAAAFTLWAMSFALRFKQDPARRNDLISAAVLMGLAMGTTVTQVVFVPFILWAAWSRDWRKTFERALIALVIVGAFYAASNFYVIAHVQDYLDEQYFLRQFAPFRFNFSALLAFFTSVLRISQGWELWILSVLGLAWSLIQKKRTEWRQMSVLVLFSIVYVAFQTQLQIGFPGTSRLFLAMIALLCVGAAAVTYQMGRLGQIARWVCLCALLVKGGVMNEHFRLDRVPRDNASLAGLWVNANIPAQATIGQPLLVPHTDCFPPIDFSKFKIVPFKSEEFLAAKGPTYAIISEQQSEWKPQLRDWRFTLIQRFNQSPLQKLGYQDPFTNANFPVEIYRRD